MAVFGTLYGAAARHVLGVPLTLLSSVLVYSGALQFAMVAMLGAGAATLPLLLIAGVLNLRHLVLGAALRSRFESGPLRRAALAFFLVDETFGFAVAAGTAVEPAAVGRTTERTLLVAGLHLYVAWLVGTLVGVLGGGLTAVEGVAGASSRCSSSGWPRWPPPGARTWCARWPPPPSPPRWRCGCRGCGCSRR